MGSLLTEYYPFHVIFVSAIDRLCNGLLHLQQLIVEGNPRTVTVRAFAGARIASSAGGNTVKERLVFCSHGANVLFSVFTPQYGQPLGSDCLIL